MPVTVTAPDVPLKLIPVPADNDVTNVPLVAVEAEDCVVPSGKMNPPAVDLTLPPTVRAPLIESPPVFVRIPVKTPALPLMLITTVPLVPPPAVPSV